MNKIISFTACAICLLFMPACAGSLLNPPPEDVPCCGENDTFEPTPVQGQDMRAGNDFVNYTEVAADYKQYGERSPRDELVTPAGAGGGVSSVVPPQIDEEVVEYEEELTATNNANATSEPSAGSAEDPVDDWLAEEGRTLKDLLMEWSDRSGWRLIWKTNRNYTLTAGAMFRGRFADVSSALIRAFGRARPAPVGTFYKGNRVLVVETLEDENAYE